MGKTRDDEIYEEGVKSGKEGGFFDDFANGLGRGLGGRDSEIYDKGYKWGAQHRYDTDSDSSSDEE